jgi:hypothetical protein
MLHVSHAKNHDCKVIDYEYKIAALRRPARSGGRSLRLQRQVDVSSASFLLECQIIVFPYPGAGTALRK